MKVAILGAGTYGLALGNVLANLNHDVTLWAHRQEQATEINEQHTSTRFFADVKFHPNLKANTNIEAVIQQSEVLIIAVPSNYFLDTVKKILKCDDIIENNIMIATVTKGFIYKDEKVYLCTQVLEDYLPGAYKNSTVYLSGPSHAEELVHNKITSLTSACEDARNSIFVRNLFGDSHIKIFPSLDRIGVQICASIKNVIAIAFGMLDALASTHDDIGDNTEAFLFAAGLNEIQTFGSHMGATHPETFTSIAGVGDLDVTCHSLHGRNRRFGRDIVLNNIIEPYNDIEELIANLHSLPYLPEGILATYYAMKLISQENIKLPIIKNVYKILNKELSPHKTINLLVR